MTQSIDYYETPVNANITQSARNSLSGKWGIAVGGYVIYMIVAIGVNIIPAAIFIVAGPLAVGLSKFSLNIARDNNAQIEDIFSGFSQFGQALIAYVLMTIAVLCGLMLFFIPGIILALGLSQTFFILADDPEISGVDALRQSWDLMIGYKGNYFLLGLRFIGWGFLCIFTLFIGFLWLAPYMQVSYAHFHDRIMDIKYPKDRQDVDLSRHLIV